MSDLMSSGYRQVIKCLDVSSVLKSYVPFHKGKGIHGLMLAKVCQVIET